MFCWASMWSDEALGCIGNPKFVIVTGRASDKFESRLYGVGFMTNQTSAAAESGQFLKNSTLYQEFLAERDEILKHKWLESERAGHDIGFERAMVDWMVKYRAQWRKSRQERSGS